MRSPTSMCRLLMSPSRNTVVAGDGLQDVVISHASTRCTAAGTDEDKLDADRTAPRSWRYQPRCPARHFWTTVNRGERSRAVSNLVGRHVAAGYARIAVNRGA